MRAVVTSCSRHECVFQRLYGQEEEGGEEALSGKEGRRGRVFFFFLRAGKGNEKKSETDHCRDDAADVQSSQSFLGVEGSMLSSRLVSRVVGFRDDEAKKEKKKKKGEETNHFDVSNQQGRKRCGGCLSWCPPARESH